MKEKIKDLSVSLRLLILGVVIFSILYSGIIGIVGQALWGNQADGSLVRRDGEIVGSELIGQEFTGPEYFHGRPSSIDYDAMKSGSQNLAPQIGALFSNEQDGIIDSLNQETIPPELENEFEDQGYPLPGDAVVVKQGENNWMIESGEEELYTIEGVAERLKVYKKSELAKRVEDLLEEFSGEYENNKVPGTLVTESGSALDPHITVRAAKFQIPRVSQNTGISEQKLRSLVEKYSKDKLLGLYGLKRVNVMKLNIEVERMMEEVD